MIATILLTSTLLSVLPWTAEPAAGLDFEVSSQDELVGSGENLAVLDQVVVENGTISLGIDTYEVRDTEWSDGNVDGMTVDGQNKPRLADASHWVRKEGFATEGRYRHSAVMDRDNNQVLLYGGLYDSSTQRFVYNDLRAYDTTHDTWVQKTSVNRAKFHHTAVWADSFHMMIVWGGVTVDGQGQGWILSETLAYWPGNNSWGWRAPCPFGGRTMHTAVWDKKNDQMLVAGGTPDGTWENVTNHLWAYRPTTNSWHQLASFPANQRRGGAAAVWDTQSEQLIMYGGYQGGNNPMSSVLSYKYSTDSWTQRGNAPIARLFHSMAWDPVGNKAYAYGGWPSNGISDDLHEYRPLQDRWRSVDEAPRGGARYWTAFIWDSVNNKGFVMAGCTERGNAPLSSRNDVLEYRTEVPYVTDGWLTSAPFDVGGALSVGELRWTPADQPSETGPDAVRFQVASSDISETPSDFVGPDGTSSTYFTDPSGAVVGGHEGKRKVAYRMYFHTDDEDFTPTIDTVDLDIYRYHIKGTYTSPVFDLDQANSIFERVRYHHTTPQDTNPHLARVVVKIRTADDADMTRATGWEEIDPDDTTIGIPYGRFFQFEVTISTELTKRHLTPTFHWIRVVYNSPPQLTLGQIDKTEGDRETWFTYSVTYMDVDNDEPTVSDVVIDGIAHPMSSTDLDFTDGSVFSYTTRLKLGEHDFYFQFSDGKNPVRDPMGEETYRAPEVLNNMPVPVIDRPTTGTRFVPDEPIEFSGASSTDPDDDELSYLWTSSLDGELSDRPAFLVKLSEGVHIVRLEVTDRFNASNHTEISILVKAYRPVLLVDNIYMDKAEPIERDRVTVTAVILNEGEVTAAPAYVEFLVNDMVVDTREEALEVGERLIASFTWQAEGERAYLAIQVRHGRTGDIHHQMQETVNVTANLPPVIGVDVLPTEVVEGEPVSFINNGTSDPNGDALTFLWEFGDGSTSSNATAQHIYETKGTYYVNLTVSDTRGGSSKELFVVTVKEEVKDEGTGLSMALLGALVLVALVVIGLVAFIKSRRGGTGKDREEDIADVPPPPPEHRRRPPPRPPTDEELGTGDPLAGIPGSPLEESTSPEPSGDRPREGHHHPYQDPYQNSYEDPTAGIPGSPLEEEYPDPTQDIPGSPIEEDVRDDLAEPPSSEETADGHEEGSTGPGEEEARDIASEEQEEQDPLSEE